MILAFFRVRSTLRRGGIDFRCAAVLIAQHVSRVPREWRGKAATFRLRLAPGLASAVFFVSIADTNRILAIPARCASMSFSNLALLESDFLQNPGLSRESQRMHSHVHKTFPTD